MKSLKLLAIAAASAAVIAPVQAQGLSFNIGAVSLYKSNGIDQDSRQEDNRKAFRPAIQGGVDYDCVFQCESTSDSDLKAPLVPIQTRQLIQFRTAIQS